ncbi:Polyketide synthase PksJ [Marinomonas spartinae]|uniref:SDR family NAD(P)-dependent oxidoreductase n=1 Tax=Marinomonas spartinae TaxID=1792290 RepID=UPI000808E0F9|nr:SDR family NAD(P)-dependent oxidoreductase [Marinomonas spartinae]SBS27151.1 Polyketide synthase PksJ [Marinomonas spartinae]
MRTDASILLTNFCGQKNVVAMRCRKSEADARSDSRILDCVIYKAYSTGEKALIAYLVLEDSYARSIRGQTLEELQDKIPLLNNYEHFTFIDTVPLIRGVVDSSALLSSPLLSDIVRLEVISHKSLNNHDKISLFFDPPPSRSIYYGNKNRHEIFDSQSSPEYANFGSCIEANRARLAEVHCSGDFPPLEIENVGRYLEICASSFPDHGISFLEQDSSVSKLTYSDLLNRAECLASCLQRKGLQSQSYIVLQLCDPQTFLTAIWGCFIGGFIPIPMEITEKGSLDEGVEKRLRFVATKANSKCIIKDDSLTLFDHSDRFSSEHRFEYILDYSTLNERHTLANGSISNSDTALVLVTSGSTGAPKLVKQTHRNLILQIDAAIQELSLTGNDRSLNWFPLDHVGALVMFHMRDLAIGMEQLQIDKASILSRPMRWIELMSFHRITISWSPNFGYGLVASAVKTDEVRNDIDLSAVRVLMNGGEQITLKTVNSFLDALQRYGLNPSTMTFAWGMSETCSAVCYLPFDYVLMRAHENSPAPVGKLVSSLSARIIDNHGTIVNEGEIGRLLLKGSPVTTGYLNDDAANASSFLNDGWFITGDNATIRDGMLTITGRDVEKIIINGRNINCQEIEAIVDAIPGISVSYTAAFSIRSSNRSTDELVVVFHSNLDSKYLQGLTSQIRQVVAKEVGLLARYVVSLSKQQIHKTSIGKIKRSLLKMNFESGALDAEIIAAEAISESTSTLPNWFMKSSWCPAEIDFVLPYKILKIMVLIGADQFSEILCDKLRSCGHEVYCIRSSNSIDVFNSQEYSVDLDQEESIDLLFKKIGNNIDIVVDCMLDEPLPYAAPLSTSQIHKDTLKINRIITFVKACIKESCKPRYICVVNNIYMINNDQDVRPGLATLRGMLAINAEDELPQFKLMDLNGVWNRDSAQFIVDELLIEDTEVAYRQGQRLIRQLIKIPSSVEEGDAPQAKQNGVYLVTGGLGGVGSALCQHLRRNYDANLLILGMRPSVDCSWLDFRCRYISCDVSNYDDLADAVKKYQMDTGLRLDGVFHLATSPAEMPIININPKVVAKHFAPKVEGALNLYRLFDGNPVDFIVYFSSVSTFFPFKNGVLYAGANAFLEEFSGAQNNRSTIPTYCYSWSIWKDIGLAENFIYSDLTSKIGMQRMTVSQGIDSLIYCMKQQWTNALCGLNPNHASISLYRRSDPNSIINPFLTMRRSNDVTVRDSLGNKLTVGDLSIHQQYGIQNRKDAITISQHKMAKASEVTITKLAAIWRQILSVNSFELEDNFFNLGGDSLKTVQLNFEVNKVFLANFSLAALFKDPTFLGMASYIEHREETGSELIVGLKTSGERPALFGVHPLFGLVYPYFPLVKLLCPTQPFFAIQANVFGKKPTYYYTIEDIARVYIDAMKSVQPTGPYHIGGWSFGALIAYEMAQQLQSAGEQVGCLINIDQAADSIDHFSKSVPWWTKMTRLSGIVKDAYNSYAFTGSGVGYRRVKVLAFTVGVLLPMLRVAIRHLRAASRYRIQKFDGDMDLFYTGDPEVTNTVVSTMGWEHYVSGQIRVYELPGSHLTIHQDPAVSKLAFDLNQIMARCSS